MARIIGGDPLFTKSEPFMPVFRQVQTQAPTATGVDRFIKGLEIAEKIVNSKAIGAGANLLAGAGKKIGSAVSGLSEKSAAEQAILNAVKEGQDAEQAQYNANVEEAAKLGKNVAELKAAAAKSLAEAQAPETGDLEKELDFGTKRKDYIAQLFEKQKSYSPSSQNLTSMLGFLKQGVENKYITEDEYNKVADYLTKKSNVKKPEETQAPVQESLPFGDRQGMRFDQNLQNIAFADKLKAQDEERVAAIKAANEAAAGRDIMEVTADDDADTAAIKKTAASKIAKIEAKRNNVLNIMKSKRKNVDAEDIQQVNDKFDNDIATIKKAVVNALGVKAPAPAEPNAPQAPAGEAPMVAIPSDPITDAADRVIGGGKPAVVKVLTQLKTISDRQGKLTSAQQQLQNILVSNLRGEYDVEARKEAAIGAGGEGFAGGAPAGTPVSQEQAKLKAAMQAAAGKTPKGTTVVEEAVPMGAESEADTTSKMLQQQVYQPEAARRQAALKQTEMLEQQAADKSSEAAAVMARKAKLPEGVTADTTQFTLPEDKTYSQTELYSLAAKADTPEKRAQVLTLVDKADVPAQTLGDMISGGHKARMAKELMAFMPRLPTKVATPFDLQKMQLQLDLLKQRYNNAKTKSEQDTIKAQAKKVLDEIKAEKEKYEVSIKAQEAGLETPEVRAARKATSGGKTSMPEASIWAKLHPSPTAVFTAGKAEARAAEEKTDAEIEADAKRADEQAKEDRRAADEAKDKASGSRPEIPEDAKEKAQSGKTTKAREEARKEVKAAEEKQREYDRQLEVSKRREAEAKKKEQEAKDLRQQKKIRQKIKSETPAPAPTTKRKPIQF